MDIKSWTNSSIPTAADFNRIEQNIKYLNDTKRDTNSIVPTDYGGTGSNTPAGARNELGIKSGTKTVKCYKSKKKDIENSEAFNDIKEADKKDLELNYITIGDRTIYFGYLDAQKLFRQDKFNTDTWIRIELTGAICVTASCEKKDLSGTAPGASVSKDNDYVFVGNDGNDCTGIMVTIFK